MDIHRGHAGPQDRGWPGRPPSRPLPSTSVALMRVDFYSEVLTLSTSMTVILPQRTSSQIGMSGGATAGDPPVLRRP